MTTSTMPADTKKASQITGNAVLLGIRDFFVHAVAQVRILSKIYAGIMHALIFWGMTIQLIGTVPVRMTPTGQKETFRSMGKHHLSVRCTRHCCHPWFCKMVLQQC